MTAEEYANKVLDYLFSVSTWVSTPQLASAIGVAQTSRDTLTKCLDRLYLCHAIDKSGRGKYYWKINVKEWSRYDPFHRPEGVSTPSPSNPSPQQDLSFLEAKVEGLDTLTVLQEEKIRNLTERVGQSQGLQEITERLKQVEALAAQGVKKVEIKVNKLPAIEVDGHAHPQLERVRRLAEMRIPVLMVGPAGSGKTYLAGQLAKSMELPFYFISCSAGMSEGHLLGRLLPTGKGGQFEYHESEFVKAYEKGGVFLFDEVDAADPNTLLILNTSLANGHLWVPNRKDKPIAKRNKDFVPLAAANTFGTGADRQYVGRNQLDEAFLDRWRMGQVTMDYDAGLEMVLCPDTDLRERLQAYRANCTKSKVRRVVSTRFLKDAYAAKCAGLTDEQVDEALFGGWNPDEKAKAKEGVQIKKDGLQYSQRESKPRCPKHPDTPMVRMSSDKGWRCGVKENRYVGGAWSVCTECIWDKKE